MSYLDKTFCASSNCKNECGRKMTEEEKGYLLDNPPAQYQGVSYAYFCGDEQDYNESSGVV